MVPRRGVVVAAVSVAVQRSFWLELNFFFLLILVVFSLPFKESANLTAFGDHEFRLFLLFVCTQTHKRDALFSTHTVTVAALPYDDEQQNPDDIIILHLSRPRARHHTKLHEPKGSSFAASFFPSVDRNRPPTQQAGGDTHTRTHARKRIFRFPFTRKPIFLQR